MPRLISITGNCTWLVGVSSRHTGLTGLLLALLAIAGCATNNVQRPALLADSTTACQFPSGFFSDTGRSYGEAQSITPRLSNLLWEGELAGFDIDRISLASDGEERLTVHAWVGDTRLDETVELTAQDRDCSDGRWRFTTSWDAQILNGVVAGLLYTGGIFLPAAERDEYSLMFTESGEIAVRYIGRITGTVFIFFPMYMKSEEVWYVYDTINTPTDLDQ